MALFIFGAGATRGCSFVDSTRFPCMPPLDRDFFTQLQRIRNPKHKTLVSDVLRDVVGLFGQNFNATMETVFTTLEHTIRMVELTGETRDFNLSELSAIKRRLIQAIAAVFEESLMSKQGSSSKLVPRSCQHHERVVASKLRRRDAIITFNYDCVLDFSLKRSRGGKWDAHYGYGFKLGAKGKALTGDVFWQPVTPAGKEETIHLLKLHGSLHFQVEDETNTDSPVYLKERPYTKQAGTGLKFSIIPPEWHKRFDQGVFAHLWSKASNAIYAASHIVVIG
jgi:hypothetical protein